MKKLYSEPSIQLIPQDVEDVIRTSDDNRLEWDTEE